MEEKIHALDKQVGLNTQALEALSKNQEHILAMQATQIETVNSIKVTLEGMGKSDEFFMKEFLDLKKEYKDHDKDSMPTRKQVEKNKNDINNLGDNQRTQNRLSFVAFVAVVGGVIKLAFFK